MPSFYDLLKYAKTGIASPYMTAYDKMRALAMAGGAKYPLATITGVPPLTFRADGRPLSAWSISGNAVQDEPNDPQFVGENTENLIEGIINNALIYSNGVVTQTGEYSTLYAPVTSGNTYTFEYSAANLDTAYVYGLFSTKPQMGSTTYNNSRTVINYNQTPTVTITIPSDVTYIGLRIPNTALSQGGGIMFVEGSTAKPYEPYGYKIQITCAGHATTVYIGDPLRKAIDGSDAVDILYSTGTIIRAVDADGNALATPTTQIIDVPPEIHTVRGSNTLMIDTTVQPSSVTITGHIKAIT